IAELRRRRVFRAAIVYVVGAFAALQGADILVPALALPDWTMTLLVVLVLLGFPVVMGLAWAFDLGPGGVTRTPGSDEPVIRPRIAAEEGPGPRPDGSRLRSGSVLAGSGRAVPSVAVVPFLNMSADAENEYFADGITEDVIAHLSKVRALRVISRTSVMPFKKRGHSLREIGAQLGATTLLDGSVRRVGDRVRIVAELVDVETDQHLWAETYDRDLTDIFSIQTDVALHIAAALEAELSPDEQVRIRKEPTANLQSYELYLKGRHLYIGYTPGSLRRAIEYFRRAIEGDPEYALAYAGIALAYAELNETGALAPGVARRQAMDAAAEALRLDPCLGEAHCAMAHLKSLWEFDWEGADAGFRRAIELSPSLADAYDFYGRFCSALGRFDEALALQRRAQELDPLAHRLDVSTTLLRAGRYAEAATETERALEFDPDHDRAHATLGWALFQQGRTAEGLAELERAVELSPGNTQWLAQLGQARGLAGDVAGARDILRRLETQAGTDFVAPYNLAYVHTGLGEHERALDLLERALEDRAGAVYAIKGSFLFAPLRPHPRFRALLAKLNLPD
ncbi:MAG TPA: tetratricopeptide repeat protein, partial [Longimicrobiales bacterium]|nr:tetratricopeptide repeat protein [Longimicrobiales bacterium]